MNQHEPRGNMVAEYNFNGTQVKVYDDAFVPPKEEAVIKENLAQMYLRSVLRQSKANSDKAAV
jgi:hypothetical protein